MKFDTTSAKILTPSKVELNVLRIRSYGQAFYTHNHRSSGDYYNSGYEWKLDLKDNKSFKVSEVPYLRGMSFVITDSFTTFLVRCYAVERRPCADSCCSDDGKYYSLVCEDVANGEFLEGAERTNTYKMIFDPNFKGQLPELDNSI